MGKAKCNKCKDIIESPPGSGKYVSCSCGAIAVDSCHVMDNGNELCRCIGNPEDFEDMEEKDDSI